MGTLQRKFVTFKLEDHLFGIDALLIREVSRSLDVTPVDRAPKHVRGLINLRGQVVTLLDLGQRLGLGQRPLSKNSGCIVLKTTIGLSPVQSPKNVDESLLEHIANGFVGLLVDQVDEVVEVDSSKIDPPPVNEQTIKRRFLGGVVRLEQGLLVTLKTSEILSLE